MKMRPLGRSGTQVSELCLGTMNFGNPRFGVGEPESLAVIAAYLEEGGNFIDTADAYAGGTSEQIVGRAVKGRRDSVVIATKGYYAVVANFGDPPAHPNALGSSRLHLTRALEDSLRRLATDYIDLYQVHCWDRHTPIDETLRTLDGFVHQGKVRYVGLSNYAAWQIALASERSDRLGLEPFVTAQMQWSLICRDIEAEVIPACERYGIGILPWSPLGQGVLTGKYETGRPGPPGSRFSGTLSNEQAASWQANFVNPRAVEIAHAVADIAAKLDSTPTAVSVAWLLAQAAVASVIIGPKTKPQLKENLAAAALELPGDQLAALNQVSRREPRYPEWFIARSAR